MELFFWFSKIQYIAFRFFALCRWAFFFVLTQRKQKVKSKRDFQVFVFRTSHCYLLPRNLKFAPFALWLPAFLTILSNSLLILRLNMWGCEALPHAPITFFLDKKSNQKNQDQTPFTVIHLSHKPTLSGLWKLQIAPFAQWLQTFLTILSITF